MHACPSCSADCDCPGNRERCEHLCLQFADEDKPLNMRHIRCVGDVLNGIPADTKLTHAIVALEDAMVCCAVGFKLGLSLERIRVLHWELVNQEAAKLAEREK